MVSIIEEPSLNNEITNPIDEILKYVANTPYNTNPNILRQMLIILQNSEKNSQQPHEEA